jgi:amino acid permease
MDWSQIYEETGSDPEPDFPTFHPPFNNPVRLISFAEDSFSSGYTYKAAYIFTINYILGVGCLGVPFGFARAGIALGSALVCLVTVLSYFTVMFVAETVKRAEELARMPCERGSKCWRCFKKHGAGGVCVPVEDDAATPLKSAIADDSYDALTPQSTNTSSSANRNNRLRSDTMDSEANIDWSAEKSYEVISLCMKFLGKRHVVMYQFSLLGLMYVGLLAYSQVFANSVQSTMSTDLPRWLLAMIFGLLVLPLSVVDLESQISVQAAMAVARFVAIFIMVAGSLYALFTDPADNESTRSSPPYIAPSVEDKMSYSYAFSGFGIIFSTALFSQLFQHSVPGLIQPLPKAHKKYVKHVFSAALSTTCFLYLLLGITAACYFGATTSSSINLNFTDFYYGLTLETASKSQLTVISVLSQVVVLFPALDTLSVFPLISNTLGNNLNSSAPHATRMISQFLKPRYEAAGRTAADRHKKARQISTAMFRLIAATPPIILSVYCSDLAFSLQLAGVAGLYVAFICPSFLQLRSIEAMNRNELPAFNEYSGFHSGKAVCVGVLVFAAFSGVVVFYQIYQGGKKLLGGED